MRLGRANLKEATRQKLKALKYGLGPLIRNINQILACSVINPYIETLSQKRA